MKDEFIITEILNELKRAKEKHPRWPVHIVSRAAIVAEEAGELIQAALKYKYEKPPGEVPTFYGVTPRDRQILKLKNEAIQTAAMCIRFLQSLENDPQP